MHSRSRKNNRYSLTELKLEFGGDTQLLVVPGHPKSTGIDQLSWNRWYTGAAELPFQVMENPTKYQRSELTLARRVYKGVQGHSKNAWYPTCRNMPLPTAGTAVHRSPHTRIPGHGKESVSAGSKSAVKRPGHAMTRTTLVVTVAFLVTQLPFYVVEILHAVKADELASTRRAAALAANVTDPDRFPASLTAEPPPVVAISPASAAEMRLYIWLNVISKMLVFVSCCINPIIYGLLNHNYSQSLAT